MSERAQRQLSAILAADVAGYSRLVGLDEEGTLARLKELRRTVIDPTIAEHRGRIVKTMGDGLLVQFSSVVDAVRCGVEMQREIAKRNVGTDEDKQIEFRMGINVGDVVIDGDDIHGDGVNVAARLEGLAEPGGVCLSQIAHDHVMDKLDLAFEDAGDQRLKNIARPVRVYRLQIAKRTTHTRPIAHEDKASIAVLPFQNMSSDPEQDFFADGLSEDLITALSKVSGLLVIARHSTFAYKGKPNDVRQIARELGVSYIAEGSVRRVASRVRITVQLINAVDGAHLWAERFDRDLDNIFAVQDEVVEKIVVALTGALPDTYVRRKRRTPVVEAYDLFVRGRVLTLQSPHMAKSARPLFEEAIRLDPGFAEAHAWLAMNMMLAGAAGWGVGVLSIDWQQDEPWERIRAAAEQALSLDPDNADAHFVLGYILAYEGHLQRGRDHFHRALRSNPNHADAWAFLGDLEVFDGRSEEAIQAIENAFKLNPYRLPSHCWFMGFAQYAAHRYAEAVETLRHEVCRGTGALRILAAALAQLGQLDEAQEVARQFMEIAPKFTVSGWAQMQPFRDPKDRDHFVEGYLKAGLPR
ncbi:MAG TPA: adenylate/guanylate cyclase domain-containing protein [Aestuariivirgaceae bacterium]